MAQKNLIGKKILGYDVIELLGTGAFGTVYKIEKTNVSGRYIRALKHITIPNAKQYNDVLNSMGGDVSKTNDYFEAMLQNIVSEVQILNTLSEKGISHIVRYYENEIETSESPRRYDIYIMMEYLQPLEDFIAQNEFTVRDVVKLGMDILDGLHACHENGVIHRDVKDDNIFVSSNGEYKIGDFGVSKVLKNSSKAESLKGTPNFLAPEVYLGKESYTKSVDLYSLGIVLYRLLNYSRNPFLPKYPAQFYAHDEDVAFEKRMSGQTPDAPSLGGEAIGDVIVKSISPSQIRFQTADAFRIALHQAVSNTPLDIMSLKVNFFDHVATSNNPNASGNDYGETLGEVISEPGVMTSTSENNGNPLHAHLFDSISTNTSDSKRNINSTEMTNGVISHRAHGRIPPRTSSDNYADNIPEAIDKNIMGKVVYAAPFIILLIGLMAYSIIIPDSYNRTVSLIDWLINDTDKIMEKLRDPNEVLPQIYRVIGLRIFWWLWLGSFIGSLFFVGRRLQGTSEPEATNAVLRKKEPFLRTKALLEALRTIQQSGRYGNRMNDIISSMQKLESRLSVESDFGYGKQSVISCENSVAEQILFMEEIVDVFDEDKIRDLMSAISNINSLLRRRSELKKHR